MRTINSLRQIILTATLGAGLALAIAQDSALAQDFRLAMSSPPNSVDPHFYNLFSNINVSDHIFETIDFIGRTDERTYAHAFFPKR